MEDLNAEFRAVVQAFDAEDFPYAVCGGLAFAIHVHPRATVDMDFLIQGAELSRYTQVLEGMGDTPCPRAMAFGGGTVQIHRYWKPQEKEGNVFTIDLLFVNDEVMPGMWESREEMRWEDLSVWVVSCEGLVVLKRLRGSTQEPLQTLNT